MAPRSNTGDLRRVGNTQNKQQAGHFEKEVLPVFLFMTIECSQSVHSIVLPLSAVFSGRNPFDLLKHAGKIVGILHAALNADFFNRKIRKAQQLLGVSNAQG